MTLGSLFELGDGLLALSSGRRPERILRAVAAATQAGCRAVTPSGSRPGSLRGGHRETNSHVPSEYRYAESTRLAVCHCIVDTIIASRAAP